MVKIWNQYEDQGSPSKTFLYHIYVVAQNSFFQSYNRQATLIIKKVGRQQNL